MNPWHLSQGAMVSTHQKAMTSLSSVPKRILQLPGAPVGRCCQPGAFASLHGVPCSYTSTEHRSGMGTAPAWTEELLPLLPEFKLEVSRLRSIRKFE